MYGGSHYRPGAPFVGILFAFVIMVFLAIVSMVSIRGFLPTRLFTWLVGFWRESDSNLAGFSLVQHCQFVVVNCSTTTYRVVGPNGAHLGNGIGELMPLSNKRKLVV